MTNQFEGEDKEIRIADHNFMPQLWIKKMVDLDTTRFDVLDYDHEEHPKFNIEKLRPYIEIYLIIRTISNNTSTYYHHHFRNCRDDDLLSRNVPYDEA